MNDDILLTVQDREDTWYAGMVNRQGRFEDALCRAQVRKIYDIMLRDGFFSDIGYEIPLETWQALKAAGEGK